jgi:hypothetical protein
MTDKPTLPSGQKVTWNEDKSTSYYSNLMGVSMTPFDMTVIFGQIGNATPTDIEGLSQAKIILSPEQVQNLIKLLSLALNRYIEANGGLRTAGALNEETFLKALAEGVVKVNVENEGR